MYFIEDESDLLGKEIIYTSIVGYVDAMVLITKDKGIFVFDREDVDETEIYTSDLAKRHIFFYLREELLKQNIITEEEVEEYENEQREIRKKREEIRKKQENEAEYNLFLQLKEKYEGQKLEVSHGNIG